MWFWREESPGLIPCGCRTITTTSPSLPSLLLLSIDHNASLLLSELSVMCLPIISYTHICYEAGQHGWILGGFGNLYAGFCSQTGSSEHCSWARQTGWPIHWAKWKHTHTHTLICLYPSHTHTYSETPVYSRGSITSKIERVAVGGNCCFISAWRDDIRGVGGRGVSGLQCKALVGGGRTRGGGIGSAGEG